MKFKRPNGRKVKLKDWNTKFEIFILAFSFPINFIFYLFFIFYVHLCCFYWAKTMLSWSSCLTPLTLLPHHSFFFFFGSVVKKRYGKRGFAIILKETISHESHNFRYSMPVWIGLLLRLRLIFTFRSLFFFFHVFWSNAATVHWTVATKVEFSAVNSDLCTIHGPTNSTFQQFFH